MDDLTKRLKAEIAAIMGPAGADYSVEPVSFYMEAATTLTEAQATIARLEAALRIVADGPMEGESMESWIRGQMLVAKTLLSPGKTEGVE